MKKNRILALTGAACLSVALLAGCGGDTTADDTTDDTASNDAAQEETAELSGTVATDGSTSMESVMGYLTEGFKEVQPGITVNYTGSGSSAGVTGAQDGTCDIGLASRDLKDDETGVKATTKNGLNCWKICGRISTVLSWFAYCTPNVATAAKATKPETNLPRPVLL